MSVTTKKITWHHKSEDVFTVVRISYLLMFLNGVDKVEQFSIYKMTLKHTKIKSPCFFWVSSYFYCCGSCDVTNFFLGPHAEPPITLIPAICVHGITVNGVTRIVVSVIDWQWVESVNKRTKAHLTSSFPVTAAHRVKDDGVRPADFVPSPCPWKGCRLVYVTGTGLAACTFCNSLFSWAAAGESGGSSCLRSSSDLRSKSNFRLDSARLACACEKRNTTTTILQQQNQN